MFLFDRRTRKVIRWVWGGFAIIIALSMVFTYSGFTRLARTETPQATATSAPVKLVTPQAGATTTLEYTPLSGDGSGTVEVSKPTIEQTTAPETPPVPQLQLDI